MEARKKKRLEQAGWKVETVGQFLGLTEAESAYIELRLALSRFLKASRLKRALTQEQLARRIRSSQSRVAKMESADPSVSLDLLIRTILALGATAQEMARVLSKAPERAVA